MPGTLLSAYTMHSSQHRGKPHTHSHLVLSFSSSCFFLGKIPLWSIPFSNKERNKKKDSSEPALHLEIAYVLKILFAYFQDAVDFVSLDLSYECHNEADLPQKLSELQVT